MSKTHDTDQQIGGRKLDHLRAIAADPEVERARTGFDQIVLTHRALPELDREKIDTRTSFLGKSISFPLLISSMTGGEDEELVRINQNLATAAEHCDIAMAVGSQRVMLNNEKAQQSFDLRPYAPTIPLLANLGAVQLNYGVGEEQCRQVIEHLQADGLYFHLNPLQEAVQPEGDTNFSNLVSQIGALANTLPVPILLKEVGAGLSGADIEAAYDAGIRHFDVAGRGGTSWSRIEYHRREHEDDDLGLVFQDWGLTTVESLLEANHILGQKSATTTLIASGGIRNGIDMAKSIILGADMCGVAAPFVNAAKDSAQTVIKVIEKFQREFKTAMFLLGCPDINTLRTNPSLIRTKTKI